MATTLVRDINKFPSRGIWILHQTFFVIFIFSKLLIFLTLFFRTRVGSCNQGIPRNPINIISQKTTNIVCNSLQPHPCTSDTPYQLTEVQ